MNKQIKVNPIVIFKKKITLVLISFFIFTTFVFAEKNYYEKSTYDANNTSCSIRNEVQIDPVASSSSYIKQLDQGKSGACYAHAAFYLYQYFYNKHTLDKGQTPSPLDITHFIKTGCSGRYKDGGSVYVPLHNAKNKYAVKDQGYNTEQFKNLTQDASKIKNLKGLKKICSNLNLSEEQIGKITCNWSDLQEKKKKDEGFKDTTKLAGNLLHGDGNNAEPIVVPPYNIEVFELSKHQVNALSKAAKSGTNPKILSDLKDLVESNVQNTFSPAKENSTVYPVALTFCVATTDEGKCVAKHAVAITGRREVCCNEICNPEWKIVNSYGNKSDKSGWFKAGPLTESVVKYGGGLTKIKPCNNSNPSESDPNSCKPQILGPHEIHYLADAGDTATLKQLIAKYIDAYVKKEQEKPQENAQKISGSPNINTCIEIKRLLTMKNQSEYMPFIEAILENHQDTLDYLAELYLSCLSNDRDKNIIKAYLLNTAVVLNQVNLVSYLIDKYGIKLSDPLPLKVGGNYPLQTATEKGYLSVIQELIRKGANPNIIDTAGNTLLHLAAKNADKETIEFLLEQGIDQNKANLAGVTPIDIAVQENKLDTVKLLVKKTNQSFEKLLILVGDSKDNRKDELRKYLSNKLVEQEKQVFSDIQSYISHHNYDKLVEILNKNENKNINLKRKVPGSTNAPTLLHFAVSRPINSEENETDREKNKENNRKIVQLLIERGAEPEKATKNPNENSILHSAVIMNKLEIMKLLIKPYRNYINSPNINGDTPLRLAVKEAKPNMEIIKHLLENNADPNKENKDGEYPIITAVKNNNYELVEILLKHKANVNIKNKDKSPLLHLAVAQDNLEMVKLLCEYGADIDAVDKSGNTALLISNNNNKNKENVYTYLSNLDKQRHNR